MHYLWWLVMVPFAHTAHVRPCYLYKVVQLRSSLESQLSALESAQASHQEETTKVKVP